MNYELPNQMHFSGHQTFPLKHNWLTKAADILNNNNNQALMNTKLCMQELGIGINMVASIRHWAESSQLFERKVKDNIHGHYMTEEGEFLFINDKYKVDRYLENQNTIWLLHYNITSNYNVGT